jgi:hypothetical protein
MEIQRQDTCDRATLERHVRAGTPLHLPGLARTWPAYEKWSPQHLAAVCGDRPVHVSHYPQGRETLGSDVLMTVAEYLKVLTDTAQGPREYYMESGFLSDLSEKLYDDLAPPEFMNDLPDIGDQVFFGCDAGSCCHIHPHEEAIVLQLIGSKVFHLYAPDDCRNLYFEPVHRDYRRSRIDFAAIDYRRFPRARRLRRIDVMLERGDALYVPVHWPHWTEGVGINFTLTRFFTARLRHYRFPSPGIRCLLGKLIQKLPLRGVGP